MATGGRQWIASRNVRSSVPCCLLLLRRTHNHGVKVKRRKKGDRTTLPPPFPPPRRAVRSKQGTEKVKFTTAAAETPQSAIRINELQPRVSCACDTWPLTWPRCSEIFCVVRSKLSVRKWMHSVKEHEGCLDTRTTRRTDADVSLLSSGSLAKKSSPQPQPSRLQ